MAMAERNLGIVLDALAEKIASLKTEVLLKEMDINNLKEKCKSLEAANTGLAAKLAEVEYKNEGH